MNTNIVSWAWWKQKLTNAGGQNGLMRFVFNEHLTWQHDNLPRQSPQSSQTDLAWVITGLLQNCPIKFPYLLWSLKGFYLALSSSRIQKAFQSGSADWGSGPRCPYDVIDYDLKGKIDPVSAILLWDLCIRAQRIKTSHGALLAILVELELRSKGCKTQAILHYIEVKQQPTF